MHEPVRGAELEIATSNHLVNFTVSNCVESGQSLATGVARRQAVHHDQPAPQLLPVQARSESDHVLADRLILLNSVPSIKASLA